jgi:hypothetical protein
MRSGRKVASISLAALHSVTAIRQVFRNRFQSRTRPRLNAASPLPGRAVRSAGVSTGTASAAAQNSSSACCVRNSRRHRPKFGIPLNPSQISAHIPDARSLANARRSHALRAVGGVASQVRPGGAPLAPAAECGVTASGPGGSLGGRLHRHGVRCGAKQFLRLLREKIAPPPTEVRHLPEPVANLRPHP